MTHRILVPVLAASLFALGASRVGSAQEAAPQPSNPTPAPAKASQNDSPPFEQITGYLDLGYHLPISFQQGVITMVNNGEKPLKILKTTGECVCTTAVPNKDLVQPGESVDFLVGMEYPLEIGEVTKKIFVQVEGYKFPFETAVSGEAGYAVRVNGGGRSAGVADLVGEIKLDSVDGRPFTVIAISGMEPRYIDFNPETDSPRTEYTVKYDFSTIPPIDLPRWVIIETDHPKARMMDIIAMLPEVPRLGLNFKWRPVKDHIIMGDIPMEAPTITTMVMSGKPLAPGQILIASSRNIDVRVDVVKAYLPASGGGIQLDLKVLPRGSYIGFLNAIVDLSIDGERTELELFARVLPPDQMPQDE